MEGVGKGEGGGGWGVEKVEEEKVAGLRIVRKEIHKYMYTNAFASVCLHASTPDRDRTHTERDTHRQTHRQTKHTHTHTHTHTRTHTHTHTHARARSKPSYWVPLFSS